MSVIGWCALFVVCSLLNAVFVCCVLFAGCCLLVVSCCFLFDFCQLDVGRCLLVVECCVSLMDCVFVVCLRHLGV